jgi:hypothetical protein
MSCDEINVELSRAEALKNALRTLEEFDEARAELLEQKSFIDIKLRRIDEIKRSLEEVLSRD